MKRKLDNASRFWRFSLEQYRFFRGEMNRFDYIVTRNASASPRDLKYNWGNILKRNGASYIVIGAGWHDLGGYVEFTQPKLLTDVEKLVMSYDRETEWWRGKDKHPAKWEELGEQKSKDVSDDCKKHICKPWCTKKECKREYDTFYEWGNMYGVDVGTMTQ